MKETMTARGFRRASRRWSQADRRARGEMRERPGAGAQSFTPLGRALLRAHTVQASMVTGRYRIRLGRLNGKDR